MAKSNLITLLESTSLQQLKFLLTAKEKLDKLQGKKASLEKDLASVDKQIASLQTSLGKTAPVKRRGRKPGRKPSKIVRAKRKPARRGKKPAQPSIQSLIVEILQEKKKPLSVNEISDALLKEKGYKTKSSNFKNQLRVLLYRNQKGLFKKVGAGQFGLAGSGKPPVAVKKKAVAKKKAGMKKKVVKKAATKKKVATKKKAAPKKKVVKKAVAKKPVAKPEVKARSFTS